MGCPLVASTSSPLWFPMCAHSCPVCERRPDDMARLKRGRAVTALSEPISFQDWTPLPCGRLLLPGQPCSPGASSRQDQPILPARMLGAVRMIDIILRLGAQGQDTDSYVFCFPKRQMPKTESIWRTRGLLFVQTNNEHI